MNKFAALLSLLLPGIALGQATPKVAGEPTPVPFKLSRTQHVVIRVKIDGKGPFNFVVDTGCPVLVISTEAAKKAGLASEKGVGVIGKLEFEGGLSLDKVKARVETPFQIEGMNSMGLPGVELHGLMGYTVLAKYKIEIDLSRERMIWTPLAFDPPGFDKMRLKEGAGANIEIMGSMLKILSRLSGLKPGPPAQPRGFVGVEIEQIGDTPTIKSVLDGSPAAVAGVKAGDQLHVINGKTVASVAEAMSAVSELRSGQNVDLAILRGGEKMNLKLKTGDGF